MEKIKLGPQTLLYPMPAILASANVNDKPNMRSLLLFRKADIP